MFSVYVVKGHHPCSYTVHTSDVFRHHVIKIVAFYVLSWYLCPCHHDLIPLLQEINCCKKIVFLIVTNLIDLPYISSMIY